MSLSHHNNLVIYLAWWKHFRAHIFDANVGDVFLLRFALLSYLQRFMYHFEPILEARVITREDSDCLHFATELISIVLFHSN